MALARSREEFRTYVLELLGQGVIEIDCTNAQIDHGIDLAYSFWCDYHKEATDLIYVKHLITQDDMTNKYIDLPPDLLEVANILDPGMTYSGSVLGNSMHYAKYQFMTTMLPNMTKNRPLYNLVQSLTYLEELNYYLGNKISYRFNKYDNRLYIDMNWNSITAGQYLVISGWFICIGNEIFGDRMFVELSREEIRKIWGENLSKFGGSLSLNGVTFNGPMMIENAERRLKELHDEIRNNYATYPAGFVF